MSGLRQGEIFGLEVKHIDFKNGTVRVEQQLITPDKGVPYLGTPKTHESYRTVPLAKAAMAALTAHLDEHPATRVEVEDRTDAWPDRWKARKAVFVFSTERREAIPRRNWSTIWGGFVAEANRSLAEQHQAQLVRWERLGKQGRPQGEKPDLVQVPEAATTHDLRHFYASVLIKHRESVKTVQRRLGHSKPSITLDIYTHLWPDEEDTTRAAIDAVFSSVPSMCPPGRQE